MVYKKNNKNIVFLAAFFLLAQFTFTILSTQHAFMDMPSICPICTAASNLDNVVSFAGTQLSLHKADLILDR